MKIFYCIGPDKYYEIQKQNEELKKILTTYSLAIPFFYFTDGKEELNKEEIIKYFKDKNIENIEFEKIE